MDYFPDDMMEHNGRDFQDLRVGKNSLSPRSEQCYSTRLLKQLQYKQLWELRATFEEDDEEISDSPPSQELSRVKVEEDYTKNSTPLEKEPILNSPADLSPGKNIDFLKSTKDFQHQRAHQSLKTIKPRYATGWTHDIGRLHKTLFYVYLISRSSNEPHDVLRVQHRAAAERRPTCAVATPFAPAAILRVETANIQKCFDLSSEKKRRRFHFPTPCHREQ